MTSIAPDVFGIFLGGNVSSYLEGITMREIYPFSFDLVIIVQLFKSRTLTFTLYPILTDDPICTVGLITGKSPNIKLTLVYNKRICTS